jgi:hypothetical protein
MAQQLVVEYGIGRKANRFFDLFDCHEGRDTAAERPWLRDAVRELSSEPLGMPLLNDQRL